MSDNRRDGFLALVKAAHDAIDEYAEDRFTGGGGWFTCGLDMAARTAMENLLAFGTEKHPVTGPQTIKSPGRWE